MKLTNYLRDAFINAVMKDVPTVDYTEQVRKLAQATYEEMLPATAKKLIKEGHRDLLKTRSIWFSDIGYVYVLGNTETVPDDLKEKIKPLVELNKIQAKTHRELKEKLRSAAYGCSTLKKLQEALPDFIKYMPGEYEVSGGRMVPMVINPIKEFTAAGFPKKETKKEKATA